ncbi:ribosome small subunit-dependent GTPase A [Bacillus chungangensis]|uniref:Small ribosomal subunit biogenesis GTPase RsgA n=1 Tax=Bacillus chungangensis TaxID=587633 RepID=A0ABT9WSZ4_9BACI|nr:ribosome small subunit-dependent GTPase A [Bacillus chungangensis]MDQ0176406.1 ribosome biogenesis GTPase [Bacillus chungangensis]
MESKRLMGWDEFFNEHYQVYQEKGLLPGKIIAQQGHCYQVNDEGQVLFAKVAGKFRYDAYLKKHYPVVGDWCVFRKVEHSHEAIIQAVLPRKSSFVRKLPISGGRKMKNGIVEGGTTAEQVIASNIDTCFIISGLDQNFDLRRIERFITLVYNSGCKPVIILNKIDLCDDVESFVHQVRKVAANIPILTISVEHDINMNTLNPYLLPGKTIVFLGSSGVGKSTITNYLLGEAEQRKQSISMATGKGKHTTTSTKLLVDSAGCMIIDTPGLREVQLWGDEEVLEQSFQDIKNIAIECKFHDCQHEKEPGCAVKKAIQNELISEDRLKSYKKQLRELKRLDKKKQQFEKHISRRKRNH